MRKKIVTAAILSSLLLGTAAGCSYTEVDTSIREVVQPESVPVPDEDPTLPTPEEGFTYIEIGESVPDYYEFTFPGGELAPNGIQGLSYTLDSVTVYPTVYESGVPFSECHQFPDGEAATQEAYEKNNFILAKFTAYYENPTGDPATDEIMFFNPFEGTYRWGEGYEEFSPNGYADRDPYVVYFDKRVREGDTDLDGNPVDPIHQGNMCRESITTGGSVEFQIGVLASSKLVEQNNVFLYMTYSEPPSDKPIYYIDLLGRFADEKSAEN